MAATYTVVTLEEMERFLRRAYRALKPTKAIVNREVVFDLHLDSTIGVRVWTSIGASGGQGADVGEDAIRIQYFHFGRGKPLTAGKAPIVKRTQNWRDSLTDRIEDVMERYSSEDAVRDEHVAMLRALVDSGSLSPAEKTAFPAMLRTLENGDYMSLTDKQLSWVRAVLLKSA